MERCQHGHRLGWLGKDGLCYLLREHAEEAEVVKVVKEQAQEAEEKDKKKPKRKVNRKTASSRRTSIKHSTNK